MPPLSPSGLLQTTAIDAAMLPLCWSLRKMNQAPAFSRGQTEMLAAALAPLLNQGAVLRMARLDDIGCSRPRPKTPGGCLPRSLSRIISCERDRLLVLTSDLKDTSLRLLVKLPFLYIWQLVLSKRSRGYTNVFFFWRANTHVLGLRILLWRTGGFHEFI